MIALAHHAGRPTSGDHVVSAPRSTDAVGHTLRGIYGELPLPADMIGLLRRLDRPN